MRLRWPWHTRETLLIDLLDDAISQSYEQVEEARTITETVAEKLDEE